MDYSSVCPADEDLSSPTPKPVTSQPEPEPQECSDQVREPATSSVPEGVLVEIEGLEGSPAHTPAAEGELQLATGKYIEELLDIFEVDLIDWVGEVVPPSSCTPVSPLVPPSPESPASPLAPSSYCAPVFPPSPTSSPKSSQFLYSVSAGPCQSLSLPSVCASWAL